MSIFTDSIDVVSSRINDVLPAELGFPYSRPTKTAYDASSTLFKAVISDEELLEVFLRNPLAKVIVNDVAEDVFEKGFKIHCTETDIEDTEEIDKELTKTFVDKFNKHIKLPTLLSYKLARLYGYSMMLIGFNDGRSLDKPVKPRAKPIFYQGIDKTWVQEIMYKKNPDGDYILPIRIESYRMRTYFIASETIHPDRVLHFENPGIDMFQTGISALLPCYDDLTVIKHVTWGAGQTMWRSGNQMVSVIGPPRASPAQLDSIDNAMTDINAQSAMTFPYGTVFEAHSPSGLNPAPYARIPLDNIAAATRIPLSILIGAQKGALASSLTDQRDYASTLTAIQSNVLTPLLNRLFWTLQKAGELPYKKFEIVWENTLTMSKPEETLTEYRTALTAERMFDLEQKKKAAETTTPPPTQFPPTTIEQPISAEKEPQYGPPLTEVPVG